MGRLKESQSILSISRRGVFHHFPLSCLWHLLLLYCIRRMIADILQEIQQYQNSRYCLKAEPMIQDYLKSHDVQGDVTHNQWEDQLYDQSLEIEPRDQPPKKSVSVIVMSNSYIQSNLYLTACTLK